MARYDSGTYAVEPSACSTSAIYIAVEFGVMHEGACPLACGRRNDRTWRGG
jgi:hypothetical protein